MASSAELVRDLRERTGAGMMDCKAALEASKGDLQGAVEHLRKKGLADAAKKQHREAKDGLIHAYIHPGSKIGVLVALESTGDKAKLEALAKQLAMHVASANPKSLTIADLDKAEVERERGVLTEKAAQSGKAVDIIAKMVEGGIRKAYQEWVLLEQAFIMDGKTKVSKVVDDEAKQVGAPVRLAGYLRFALGEGIEKKSEDFAAEVAAQLKK